MKYTNVNTSYGYSKPYFADILVWIKFSGHQSNNLFPVLVLI